MRPGAALALVTPPLFDAGVLEFLRIVVGLVAGGETPLLLEIGPGAGLLSGRPSEEVDLPEEGERYLEALADFGVRPATPSPAALREALGQCTRLLRIADPQRPGQPELLVVDAAYLAQVSDEALLRDLCEAGQVIRQPRSR